MSFSTQKSQRKFLNFRNMRRKLCIFYTTGREFIRHCRFQNLEEVKERLSRDVDVNTVSAGLIASIAGYSESKKECVELLRKITTS